MILDEVLKKALQKAERNETLDGVLKRLLKGIVQHAICKKRSEEVSDETWKSLLWMTQGFHEKNWEDWRKYSAKVSSKDILESFYRVKPLVKDEAAAPYIKQIDAQWLADVVERSLADIDPESLLHPLGSA